jgi:hypothetical protein
MEDWFEMIIEFLAFAFAVTAGLKHSRTLAYFAAIFAAMAFVGLLDRFMTP